MPRVYKKKGLRCQWKPDDLKKARDDISRGVFTVRAASRAYSIPRTTLQEYMNERTRKYKLSAEHVVGHTGRYPALGWEFEKELCDHAKQLSELYFGITKEKLCKLAYELAWKNGLHRRFNVEKRIAGDDWFHGFMARNPTISLRKPESTSLARVMGFRRSEVNRFFDNLKQVYEKEKFEPTRIYNVDETGMTTVQQQKQKIIAPTGKKQVGKIVSAEKGETITAVVCVSAAGVFVTPVLIFPRKNMNSRLLVGAPPGTVGLTSPSGWINADLYLQWLKHFVKHSGATVDRKVLLILDNHESHVTLQACDLCRDNGVVVVSLPPHCSHKCQPLDLSVFGPLKTAYYKRCSEWLHSNSGKRITQYEVASLFGDAYCSISNIQKCVSGFRAAGIYPFNSGVFSDEDFLAAENLMQSHAQPETDSVAVVGAEAGASTPAPEGGLAPAEGPSPHTSDQTAKAVKKRISVTDISPLPSARVAETGKRRKCKRSEIITSSPMKSALESKASQQKQKETAENKTTAKSGDSSRPTKRKNCAGDKDKTKRKKTSASTGLHFCISLWPSFSNL